MNWLLQIAQIAARWVTPFSAFKNVMAEKGVTHLAAICAICKSQFTKVFPYYGIDMFNIVSVHQLVSNAIVLNRKTAPEDAPGYGEDDDE